MAQGNTLSLFVDESGILGEPATASRFYILGFVMHDQRLTIEPAAVELARRLEEIGQTCFLYRAAGKTGQTCFGRLFFIGRDHRANAG